MRAAVSSWWTSFLLPLIGLFWSAKPHTKTAHPESAAGPQEEPAGQGAPANPASETIAELRVYAEDSAMRTSAIRPDPVVVARLRQRAVNTITLLWKGAFNPQSSYEDRALQNGLDDTQRERERIDDGRAHLTHNLSEAKRAIVAVEPPPKPSMLVMACCVTGYGLAIGSSLLVLPVFGATLEEAPLLAFTVTFLLGCVFGLLACSALFDLHLLEAGAAPALVQETDASTWPVTAGITMIVAFGVMRAFASIDPGEWTATVQNLGTTAALCLLDIAILGYLKTAANRHLMRMHSWRAKMADRPQKVKRAAGIEAELNGLIALRPAAVAAEQAAHRARYLRECRDFDLAAVSKMAADEAETAYLKRVDDNAAGLKPGR